MENLALKVKISVLLLVLSVGALVSEVLFFIKPGTIEEVMTGEVGGIQLTAGVLLFFALLWLASLSMAFLSLILTDTSNRWANIVLGVFFTGFGIFDVVTDSVQGLLSPASLVIGLWTILVAALIVWYAWKWPKQGV
jgi:hypothetical protein